MLEYRGVYTKTGKENIFIRARSERDKQYRRNYLAIVHALALLKQKNSQLPLYSRQPHCVEMGWYSRKSKKPNWKRMRGKTSICLS
jgi:ribonuclease HI